VGRSRQSERGGDPVHRRRAVRRQQSRRGKDPDLGRHAIDLRNIRSPIVVFCSKGDNVTPPQQALGWIRDLYENVDQIRSYGQTIVYTVHEIDRTPRHLRLVECCEEGARRVLEQYRL
jgi:hypothetical protein